MTHQTISTAAIRSLCRWYGDDPDRILRALRYATLRETQAELQREIDDARAKLAQRQEERRDIRTAGRALALRLGKMAQLEADIAALGTIPELDLRKVGG